MAVLAAGVVAALPAGAGVRASPGRAAFALLEDGRLVRVRLSSGAIRVRRLGPVRRTAQSGPLVAVDARRRLVYVLLRRGVVAVDARTLAVRRRIALPPGLRYRGLALGRASGRLYVSANRAVRVLVRSTGLAEEAATLTIVDPRSGAIVAHRVVREAARRSWHVYWLGLTPDEKRVAFGYHGGCDGVFDVCTTGADVLEVEGNTVRPCVPVGRRFRGAACSPDVHGAVFPYRDGFLAATGGSPLVELDRAGNVVRRLETRMAAHLMDFAVDGAAGTAYAVGSCDKGGGLRAIDLSSGAVRRLRTARGARALCGSRVAVASSASLVVATGRATPVLPVIRPAVLVVDSRTGRTSRRVPVGARILELVTA